MPSVVPEMVDTGRLTPTRQATLDRHAEWWEMRRQGYTIYTIAAKYGVTPQAVSKAMGEIERKLYVVMADQLAEMRASQTAMLEANLERALVEWFKSQQDAEKRSEVEKTLAATSSEHEEQGHGGSLKRRRKQPLQAGDVADDSEQKWDTVDLESIPGYFYDEATGEETIPEERPGIVASWLMEKVRREREGGPRMAAVLERTVTTVTEGQCGDPRYLAEIRSCLAEIRKIWGLDAPKKAEVITRDGDITNEERAARIAAILERGRDRRDKPAG